MTIHTKFEQSGNNKSWLGSIIKKVRTKKVSFYQCVLYMLCYSSLCGPKDIARITKPIWFNFGQSILKAKLKCSQNIFFFTKELVLLFQKPSCVPLLIVLSQNRGSRCTLPHSIGHLDIKTMKCGGVMEAGQNSKVRGGFLIPNLCSTLLSLHC